MKSLLKDMYNGKMRPFGEYHIDTPRYRAALKAENQARGELLAAYPGCEEILNKLMDASLTVNDETAFTQFLIGFRFGAQIMSEMTETME